MIVEGIMMTVVGIRMIVMWTMMTVMGIRIPVAGMMTVGDNSDWWG